MDSSTAIRWLEQIAGTVILVLALLDVFLTVLYARAGKSILSRWVARLTWLSFRSATKPFAAWRPLMLSFCGPCVVVLFVLVWSFVLAFGAALIIHPHLGTEVKNTSGTTATDFLTALYVGGISMSIVGSSNYVPQTLPLRMVYLVNSVIGVSVTSLALTYVMQVYSALLRRNTIGLNLYLLTRKTGDAAELISGAGPRGKFDSGYTNLSQIGTDVSSLKEVHHFYPVLFYYRFGQPFYSLARAALVALDTVTLLRTALSDDRELWIVNSAAVWQLWDGSMEMLKTVEAAFVPNAPPDSPEPPDDNTRQRWRCRYFAALDRLREAGIPTVRDVERGADSYAEARTEWQAKIEALAGYMGFEMDEIDPAVAKVTWQPRELAPHHG